MKIKKLSIYVILVALSFSVIGCPKNGGAPDPEPAQDPSTLPSGSDTRWSQYHGDLASRGFLLKQTRDALRHKWSSAVSRVYTSSPVLGRDSNGRETLYIGTTDATLIALDTENGNRKWFVRVPGSEPGSSTFFITTPAVAPNGDIIFTTSQKMDDRAATILHKVHPSGHLVWSIPLPEEGYTSGSPKVLQDDDGRILIFLWAYTRGSGELIAVLDRGRSGTILDRKSLVNCPLTGDSPAFSNFLDELWDFITTDFDTSAGGIFDDPPFRLDPTIAILKERDRVDIAVTDKLCSIGVLSWKNGRLERRWAKQHDQVGHGSPTILANGLMAYNRAGKLVARDINNGNVVWEFSDGSVGPPAVPLGQFVFVLSIGKLTVIHSADGKVIVDNGRALEINFSEIPIGYPVVSTNHVHIATSDDLKSFNFRLSSVGHDQSYRGVFHSGPAIGEDGALYVVHHERSPLGFFRSEIRKYE